MHLVMGVGDQKAEQLPYLGEVEVVLVLGQHFQAEMVELGLQAHLFDFALQQHEIVVQVDQACLVLSFGHSLLLLYGEHGA